MESPQYAYDAFISYRHCEPDKTVAIRLQELLENYKPPRGTVCRNTNRIRRIFRDQSELPTSGDLGADIRRALESSRYLIVICSEKTRESAWCEEEIRYFKKLHNGQNDHILTMLVSGQPDKVFPDRLCWEERQILLPDGSSGLYSQRVEPLSADVRAPSPHQIRKKLRTEFLRVAAPLLGCSYDELFRRHQRRIRKRNTLISTAGIGGLAAVLCIVSLFAYRTWVSEQNYKTALSDTRILQGEDYAASQSPQEALAYFAEALSLSPEQSAASAGAALLLQDWHWPVWESETAGIVTQGAILPAGAVSACGDFLLFQDTDGWYATGTDGTNPARIETDGTVFAGASAGYWTFRGNESFLFYHPETKIMLELPFPTEQSSGISEPTGLETPTALAVSSNAAVVAYGGYLSRYEWDETGSPHETARIDLADIFPEDAAEQVLMPQHQLWLSEDARYLLVSAGSHVMLAETETLFVRMRVQQYHSALTGAAFSADSETIALLYGNPYHIAGWNTGSSFAVYNTDGELLFASEQNPRELIRGAQFDPENPARLLVWGRDFVRVWDWTQPREILAPLLSDEIESAAMLPEGIIAVQTGEIVTTYNVIRPDIQTDLPQELPSLPDTSAWLTAQTETGMTLELSGLELILWNKDGIEADRRRLPAQAEKVALLPEENAVVAYSRFLPVLVRIPLDAQNGKLGEPQQLDTGGSAISAVWPLGSLFAAETPEGSLLLYEEEEAPKIRITPQQSGTLSALLCDGEQRYLAAVLEEKQAESGSVSFETAGAVEIWDLQNGLLLETVPANGEISAASFTETGALCWQDKTGLHSRQLVFPEPDRAAVAMLQNLSCLETGEKQELISKQPSSLPERTGNWGSLITGWQKGWLESGTDQIETADSSSQEALPEASAIINELQAAEDYGTDAWFERTESLWKEMEQGKVSFEILDADNLYTLVNNAARTEGLMGWMGSAISGLRNAYRYAAEMGIDLTFSNYTSNLLATLDDTRDYDGEIAAALQEIASLLETNPDIQLQYSALYSQTIAGILAGEAGADELLGLAETCMENPETELLAAEPMLFASLMTGDAQSAADTANQWIAMLRSALGEDSYAEGLLLDWLSFAAALNWREKISSETLASWINHLDAKAGIQVTSLSPEASQTGILQDDIIRMANGTPIASPQHFQRLREEGGAWEAGILRSGEEFSLSMPGNTTFGGKPAVVFPAQ